MPGPPEPRHINLARSGKDRRSLMVLARSFQKPRTKMSSLPCYHVDVDFRFETMPKVLGPDYCDLLLSDICLSVIMMGSGKNFGDIKSIFYRKRSHSLEETSDNGSWIESCSDGAFAACKNTLHEMVLKRTPKVLPSFYWTLLN